MVRRKTERRHAQHPVRLATAQRLDGVEVSQDQQRDVEAGDAWPPISNSSRSMADRFNYPIIEAGRCGSVSGPLVPGPTIRPMARSVDVTIFAACKRSTSNTKTWGSSCSAIMPRTMRKSPLQTMRDNGITFPLVFDTSDEARRIRSQDYKINGYEAKDYVIDRTGKIVAGFYNQREDDEPFLEKADGALQAVGGELAASMQRKIDAQIARSADQVSAAAHRLFQALRNADYNKDWSKPKDWNQFPSKGEDYDVARNFPGWVKWVCNKFKADPIVDVQLGKVFADSEGRPTVHFRLTLKDGEILQGDLPFIHSRRSGRGSWTSWTGVERARLASEKRSAQNRDARESGSASEFKTRETGYFSIFSSRSARSGWLLPDVGRLTTIGR